MTERDLPSAGVAKARSVMGCLLALAFPTFCVVCRAVLSQPNGGPLCRACFDALPRHRDPLCACGVPRSGGDRQPCGRCRRGLSPFDAGASLGPYEGSLKTVVQELKYRRRHRLAGRLAEALLAQPAVQSVLTPDVLLAPVPLHPRRERERGYNQSELIARALGRSTGLPVLTHALVRRRDTPAQAGLGAAARRRNVAGAFAVRQAPAVAGHIVVLVDDVLTTGATARTCASALRGAGAIAVRLLTVARVG